MTGSDIRVGLVGAGYIAGWHAATIARLPGLRLTAVCDPAPGAAQGLANAFGAGAFDSLDALLAAGCCDAVHILTPPHLHHPLAMQALGAGLHVLVEKPFATSVAEAEAMQEAARAADRRIGVNHNFLGLPAMRRLRAALDQGLIGRPERLDVHWHYPLAPLRTGPYGLWMLREPANLLKEIGPHLHAFAHDLLGPLADARLSLSRPVTLPTGVTLPQAWQVQATAPQAGDCAVTLSVSLVEGHDDRSVTLRGAAGMARLDYAADTLIIARANASDIVVNPLRQALSLSAQHLREGLRNAWVQTRSLNRRQPYALGFEGVFTDFYAAIRENRPLPGGIDAGAAVAVTGQIERLGAELPAAPEPVADTPPASPPDALVIGGTGFLGRALVHRLAGEGLRVGVLSRSRANPFADLGGAVRLIPADLQDEAALSRAMIGVDTVYHLARTEEADWDGYLKNDVAVTERLARAAIAAGVRRFVYTGTIASYDASDPAQRITEETPFGDMTARNLYARSKALCEERLQALARDRGLPLVIARPGIVVGPGGPLQHWGIGRWHGAGAVRIWGQGHHKLPFVLNEDVAEALARMRRTEGIEGQSFNLVGPPLMSAQDWFQAIAQLTGTRITVATGNLTAFWLSDLGKYALKRLVLRRRGLTRPLRRDWLSRAHLSRFDHTHACRVLGWQPEGDAQRFARRALVPQALFGY